MKAYKCKRCGAVMTALPKNFSIDKISGAYACPICFYTNVLETVDITIQVESKTPASEEHKKDHQEQLITELQGLIKFLTHWIKNLKTHICIIDESDIKEIRKIRAMIGDTRQNKSCRKCLYTPCADYCSHPKSANSKNNNKGFKRPEKDCPYFTEKPSIIEDKSVSIYIQKSPLTPADMIVIISHPDNVQKLEPLQAFIYDALEEN